MKKVSKKHVKSVIIAINKWDLVPNKTPTTINDYFKYYSQQFDFSPQTPIIFISALEHQRTTAILDLVQSVYDFQLHWMTHRCTPEVIFGRWRE